MFTEKKRFRCRKSRQHWLCAQDATPARDGYAFVVPRRDHRKIVHFNVTAHPTAAWTAQQITEAFPDDTSPQFLIRDRDSIYGAFFQQRVRNTY